MEEGGGTERAVCEGVFSEWRENTQHSVMTCLYWISAALLFQPWRGGGLESIAAVGLKVHPLGLRRAQPEVLILWLSYDQCVERMPRKHTAAAGKHVALKSGGYMFFERTFL